MTSPADNNLVLYPKPWVVIVLWMFPVIALAVGYAFDNYAWPRLMEWLSFRNEVDPLGTPIRRALLLGVLIGGMAATGITTAGYLLLLGFRVLRTRVFPPRGLPIIAPTKVLHGAPALRKAAEILFLGALILAISGYVIWSVFSIFPEAKTLLSPLFG